MKVNQFVKKVREDLSRFETWWIENRMMDPDSETFPETMTEADWEEQFAFFCQEVEQ